MTEERDVLSAEQRLLNAFDYAQGYDVAGWEGHLPKESVRIKFIAALDALRVCLDETRRQRDEAQEKSSRRAELQQYALTEYAAAEAEVARLREALTEIAGTLDVNSGNWFSRMNEICTVAEEALSAAVSTPSDEPPLPGLGKFLGHLADREDAPVSTPKEDA